MPYKYPDKVPSWAKNKSASIQKTAIEVFNETLKETDSEEKARIASISAMKNKEKKVSKSSVIQKSLNQERRLATFIVLEPQDDDLTTTDLHEDWYDEETILDACIEFNKSLNFRKGSLMHMVETEGYSFIESYVTPAEMKIGDQVIKKGTWLQTIMVKDEPQYDWIWEGIKEGKFNGLSVECTGIVEEIETEE